MSRPIIVAGMELRQLRAFVEVAEAGHFGHAREPLHLTQPALTAPVQGPGRELGLQLPGRNARGGRVAPRWERITRWRRWTRCGASACGASRWACRRQTPTQI